MTLLKIRADSSRSCHTHYPIVLFFNCLLADTDQYATFTIVALMQRFFVTTWLCRNPFTLSNIGWKS